MHQDRIKELLERYLDGTCTEEERQLLHIWFATMSAQGDWEWSSDIEKAETKHVLQSQLKESLHGVSQRKLSLYQRYRKQLAIAASFILLMGVGAYFLYRMDPVAHLDAYLPAVFDTKAKKKEELEVVSITLPNGKEISIDSITGSLPQRFGNLAFFKLSKDELVLEAPEGAEPINDNLLASINVPKGRDFKVTLYDGTKAWLNADTKLILPTHFKGHERTVMIKGEAFFEVAKNRSKPFKVKAKDTDIQVLGTSFNVNAYDDDVRVITTLATGSVQVSTKEDGMLLQPNQQAITYINRDEMMFRQVSAEDAAAWKNGYFVFNQEDIYGIMRMVARWYNVEVYYQGTISTKKFGGTFAKAKTIDELLNYLESLGNFRFKQKGRRVIVVS